MMKFLNLNTRHTPIRGFMDETERMWCSKCRNWFNLGNGMWNEDSDVSAITRKHMELCEGDHVITLMKIEQWFKETYRR